MTPLTTREKQVANWATQEIDSTVKLGDVLETMLETDGGLFTEVAHAVVDHTNFTGVLSTPAANQVASVEATTPTVAEFNSLIAKLKTAGLMVADI